MAAINSPVFSSNLQSVSALARPASVSASSQALPFTGCTGSMNATRRNTVHSSHLSSAGSSFNVNGLVQYVPKSKQIIAMNMDSNSYESDHDSDEYLEAHVMDAVRMVPYHNRLYMTMSNGTEVEVRHVSPMVGRLLYEDSTPTIFLKISQTTDLMLPICVGELAIGMLMKGFKRELGIINYLNGAQTRPNCYELLKNLVNILKYEVRMVRVTQRVADTYYARVYLAKPGDASDNIVSVDARPSDAINLAVRCKAPIYVSKKIVMNDAVRIAYNSDLEGGSSIRKDELYSDLDVSSLEPDTLAEEMFLIKTMNLAAEEERYADAARIRDELNRLRNGTKGKINF